MVDVSDPLAEYQDAMRALHGISGDLAVAQRQAQAVADRERSETSRRDAVLRERLNRVTAEHATLVRRSRELRLTIPPAPTAGPAGSDPLTLAEQVVARAAETLRQIAEDDAAIRRAAERLEDERRRAEQAAAEQARRDERVRADRLVLERAARRQRQGLLAITVLTLVLIGVGVAVGSTIAVPIVLVAAVAAALLLRSTSTTTRSGA